MKNDNKPEIDNKAKLPKDEHDATQSTCGSTKKRTCHRCGGHDFKVNGLLQLVCTQCGAWQGGAFT